MNLQVDMNCDVDAAPTADVRWVDADDKNIVTVPGKSEVREYVDLEI